MRKKPEGPDGEVCLRSPVAVGVAFDLEWERGGDGAAEDVAVGREFELWV